MAEMYKTYRSTITDNPLINDYLHKIPFKNQILFLCYPTEELLYGGMAGGGKALDVNTLIPTINGFKKMRDIQVGDIVFTENGEPTPVLAISPIYYNHKCYQLDFKTVSVVCDEGHAWNVKPVKHPQYSFKNYTTKELTEINKKFKVPASGIVKYNNKTNLPSYTIGAWLNNGFTTGDPEILEYIEKEGFTVKKRSGKYEYGLHTILRKNNLLKNKHIPPEYFTASYDDRLKLIQGLMDTDGNITKNGKCEFVQKNYNIINGLRLLLASLGVKCNITTTLKKSPTMEEPKQYYKLTFHTTLPVFRLNRKKKRLPKQVKQSYTETINDITEVESRPVKCIKVANPTGLYLATEQYIPTHNSEALLLSALQYINTNTDQQVYDALILRRTLDDLEMPNAILDRAKQWLLPLEDTGLLTYRDIKKQFRFNTGATLTFRYLAHDNDLNKYQGAELQFIGFDELTQFTEKQYKYLHSRLRKTEDNPIPLRMRGASNPGGIGHDWVKKRFIGDGSPCCFIPSAYTENPYLNQKEYGEQLDKLDEVTRQQLKYGNWDIVLSSGYLMDCDTYKSRLISYDCFKDWKPVYTVIGVDPASTGTDKFAMSCLFYFSNSKLVLVDIDATPDQDQEDRLRNFILRNQQWKPRCVNFEREAGSSPHFALNYWGNLLGDLNMKLGFYVTDTPASKTGSKYNRAYAPAYHIRNGDLLINRDIPVISFEGTVYNPVQELGRQLVYTHPDPSVMKGYPSPDEQDSLAYAFEKMQESISGLSVVV